MSDYIPCMECKNRYGREYSKLCDGFCDYAKATNEMKKLQAFKRYWDSLCGEDLIVTDAKRVGGAKPYETFYDSAIRIYERILEIDDKHEDG